MTIKRSLTVILLLVWLALGAFPSAAQTSLEVLSDQAEMDFPNSLTFRLRARGANDVDEVTLEYGTNGRSCVAGTARQEADLSPGSPFEAEWEWDFVDSGSLPVGAEVWWQWVVRTGSGTTLRTERQTLVIEDPTLDWQRIENDQVLLVWSEGSQAFAKRILDLSTHSLERLAEEAGIEPEGKVRLTVYPSFESMRAARLFAPEWSGGVAFPDYGLTMLGIPVDSGDWMEDVVPHELAHLVTGQRVFNCFGVGMPTWLSEGLSVYSEGAENPVEAGLVLDSLSSGRLPPLRNLAAGFPADANATTLAYAQSGEIVRFLVREYGPDKMGALLAAIQSGSRINTALQQVYEFDTDGLDNVWRAALGYAGIGPQVSQTPTVQYTQVPTLALMTSVVQLTPTSTAEKEQIEVAAAPSATPTAPSPTDTPVQEAVPTENEPGEETPGGLSCFSIPLGSGLYLGMLWLVRRRKYVGE